MQQQLKFSRDRVKVTLLADEIKEQYVYFLCGEIYLIYSLNLVFWIKLTRTWKCSLHMHAVHILGIKSC